MSTYKRPTIDSVEFRDESGSVIDYGNRWADLGVAPDEMYEVVDHPERFKPLHTIASAVVTHVTELFEVDSEEGYGLLSAYPHVPDPEYVDRVVRLTPRSPQAAPITFVWINSPAASIFAGALFHTSYPSCACNACDERWDACADELEEQVFSIISGGLSEHISKPKHPKWSYERGLGLVRGMGQTVSHSLLMRDGISEESGGSSAESIPAELLEAAQLKLRRAGISDSEEGWVPWPKKEPQP